MFFVMCLKVFTCFSDTIKEESLCNVCRVVHGSPFTLMVVFQTFVDMEGSGFPDLETFRVRTVLLSLFCDVCR